MKRISSHTTVSGKTKVADLFDRHDWCRREDLEALSEEITGDPLVQGKVFENEKSEIGYFTNDGWSAAIHKNERSFVEHRYRIVTNKDRG